jgi:hypothetical protein
VGKVAGAALKIAAPEAAVASKAAGAGKDPRKTAPGSKAAQQREEIEQIKARRKPADEPADEHEDQDDEHEPEAAGGGLGNALGGMQGPATGGGFVLGVIVWALVRAYIGNEGQPSGAAGVKRLVRAKFLNKTD